ncbi:MAG: PIN domain-containing protein [Actinomycetaceae bacterium]|nr:PIN domain-containing protein [Actinomycetaceae bacterium]
MIPKEEPLRVKPRVFLDANVLYSRVLRDYLLYSATLRLISVQWSCEILDEVITHLMKNRPTFTPTSAQHLLEVLEKHFPYSMVKTNAQAITQAQNVHLPDENDHHVFVSAISGQATILCTNNIRDFPKEMLLPFEITPKTPDQLLTELITASSETMLAVHKMTVINMPNSSDQLTLNALQRAGATNTAEIIADLLQSRETLHRTQQ